MRKEIIVNVHEVVGKSFCFTSEEGQRVYDELAALLRADSKIKYKVKVSFQEVELVTPTFLNSAIGQLYGKFSEQKIRDTLSVVGMKWDGSVLLKKVVDTAKRYFKNTR